MHLPLKYLLHAAQVKFVRIIWCDNANVIRAKAAHLNYLEDTISNDLADALNSQDIPVEGYHPESGPGQQEMTFRYGEATLAADRQIIYRETARGVAARHGLVASFLPKILEEKAGAGCHLNLSLAKDGINITGDPQGTAGFGVEAAAFLAGILAHLPALAAITIPSKNSFRRLRPHFWAGAFRAWGYDNREGAVRALRDQTGSRASRLELKTVDATANPYLALGAVIAAGLDGIRRRLPLPDEVTVDPGLIPVAERNQRGIDLLPQTLGEAIDALKGDAVLLKALGEPLSRSFIAVREKEWEALKDMDLKEEVAILAQRY